MQDVMQRSVPQIKGLRVEDLFALLKQKLTMEFIISPKTTKKLHWIGNKLSIYVLYKLYNLRQYFWPRKFKEMISKAIKDRLKFILGKNSMEIIPDPRIVNLLNSSSMLSSKF